MPNIDHLHQETKIIPIKQPNELLYKQYLWHVTNEIIRVITSRYSNNPAQRSIVKDLPTSKGTCYYKLDEKEDISALKTIHSATVNNTISSYKNLVLDLQCALYLNYDLDGVSYGR